MFYRTKRTYTDVQTNHSYSMYFNEQTQERKLVYEGKDKTVNAKLLTPFFCVSTPVDIKINNNKIISLSVGTFYNLQIGEVVTHKKFCGFNEFSKV